MSPDELDEISAPVSVDIAFLIYGGVFVVVLVGVSKLRKFSGILDFLGEEGLEFVVDVVFETTWRSEVRRRIEETKRADGSTAPRVAEGPLSHDSGTNGAPRLMGDTRPMRECGPR